jgi:hypothetical protein
MASSAARRSRPAHTSLSTAGAFAAPNARDPATMAPPRILAHLTLTGREPISMRSVASCVPPRHLQLAAGKSGSRGEGIVGKLLEQALALVRCQEEILGTSDMTHPVPVPVPVLVCDAATTPRWSWWQLMSKRRERMLRCHPMEVGIERRPRQHKRDPAKIVPRPPGEGSDQGQIIREALNFVWVGFGWWLGVFA